jgi:hypothetical protein
MTSKVNNTLKTQSGKANKKKLRKNQWEQKRELGKMSVKDIKVNMSKDMSNQW